MLVKGQLMYSSSGLVKCKTVGLDGRSSFQPKRLSKRCVFLKEAPKTAVFYFCFPQALLKTNQQGEPLKQTRPKTHKALPLPVRSDASLPDP